MDRQILNRINAIPLPRGDEAESWLIDTTPPTWLERPWPTQACPYRYTVCGTYLRLAMACSKLPTLEALRRLTDHVHRWQREVHDAVGMARDADDEDVATLVLMRAVYEPDSPFIIITVNPNGRAAWYGGRYASSGYGVYTWHPDGPRRHLVRGGSRS